MILVAAAMVVTSNYGRPEPRSTVAGPPVFSPPVRTALCAAELLKLTDEWLILANMSDPGGRFAASELQVAVRTTTGLTLQLRNGPGVDCSTGCFVLAATGREQTNTVAPGWRAAARNFDVAQPVIGPEGYAIAGEPCGLGGLTRGCGLTIVACGATGLFYGVQTLRQMLVSDRVEAAVWQCAVTDWPDLAFRAMHLGTWVDKVESHPVTPHGLNVPALTAAADFLASHKYNRAILGTRSYFFLDDPNTTARLDAVHGYFADRRITLIPSLPTGDDGHGAMLRDPSTLEGVWVRSEPFVAEPGKLHILPKSSPATGFPRNGNFTNGSTGWTFTSSDSGSKSCRVDTGSVDTVGTPSIRCESFSGEIDSFSGRARSDCFPVKPHSSIFISFLARGENISGGASYMSPEVVIYQWSSEAASRNPGPIDAEIPYLAATLRDTRNGTGTLGGFVRVEAGVLLIKPNASCVTFETLQHGIGGGVWWITDVVATRLNGALLNVVRTASSDVVVTGVGGTPQYKLGVDYEIINSTLPNDGSVISFSRLSSPYQINRIHGGAIAAGAKLEVSYDFLPGAVDTSGHSHPNCFVEPRYVELMDTTIAAVVKRFRPPAIMFDHDEIRGINRDSRSLGAGLTNAELLALEMNQLAASCARAGAHNGLKVAPMFWDDMVNEYHNGADPLYQIRTGGGAKYGATGPALQNLSKSTELISWWYGWDPTIPSDNAASVLFFNGTPGMYAHAKRKFYASMWFSSGNIQKWAEITKAYRSLIAGWVSTSWNGPFAANTVLNSGAALAASLAWNLANGSKPFQNELPESGSQTHTEPWLPYAAGIRASVFPITAQGAVGDNATMNTGSINAAFAACARAGGGWVTVPPGVFLTGQVTLRSGCYLVLAQGGILQATTNVKEYGPDRAFWALVVGNTVTNTGVIAPAPGGAGPGANGGQISGTMWQSIGGYDPTTNTLTKNQTAWPGAAVGNLLFQDSINVSVIGVRIVDSGFWAQTFRRCRNVLEELVVVEGSVQWGTADGLDVESGYNLTFRDSVFKTGDDCLAFRSGSYEQLPWPPGPIAPVQMVRVSNMTLTSSSAAIKLEASTISNRTDVGDIFDVEVDNIRIVDSNRGIGVWQRTGDRASSGGGSLGHGAIRDVVFSNILSTTRFDSKPEFWGSGEPFVLTVLPVNDNCCVGIRNLTVVNMTAVAENGVLISSFGDSPGHAQAPPIVGVHLENVSITIKKTGNTSRPQLDYRPAGHGSNPAGVPDTVPVQVTGITVQNVAGLSIAGSMVEFSPSSGSGREPYWGMGCLNVTGHSYVSVDCRWRCKNGTSPVNCLRCDSSVRNQCCPGGARCPPSSICPPSPSLPPPLSID